MGKILGNISKREATLFWLGMFMSFFGNLLVSALYQMINRKEALVDFSKCFGLNFECLEMKVFVGIVIMFIIGCLIIRQKMPD